VTRRKLSRTKIKEAIPLSGGMISAVCRKCGYTWSAVRDAIKADPELVQLMTDEEERINDMAENTIIRKIQSEDERTAMWWLARKRKASYGDAIAVDVKGEIIHVTLKKKDD
jgi:DNA-directed RNA polymerase subunit M/transcription elongation factor TFIIS